MCNYKEILPELREEYDKCNELFDIAYDLNNNENTRTAFNQKVTTYMPELLQTISYLIGEFKGKGGRNVNDFSKWKLGRSL